MEIDPNKIKGGWLKLLFVLFPCCTIIGEVVLTSFPMYVNCKTNQSLGANWMLVHEWKFLHLLGAQASALLYLSCNSHMGGNIYVNNLKVSYLLSVKLASRPKSYHDDGESTVVLSDEMWISCDITSIPFFLCSTISEARRCRTSWRHCVSLLLVKHHKLSLKTKTSKDSSLERGMKTTKYYIKQYSATSITTALAVPSCSSRRLISSGSTTSVSLWSVWLFPGKEWGLKMIAFSMQTTPSITSSSTHWSFKMGKSDVSTPQKSFYPIS